MAHRAAAGEDEIDVRLELLAEDLSRELDPAACDAGIKVWVARSHWFPLLSDIVEASADFRHERRARRRDERAAEELASRLRLPPPVYVDLTTEENEKALADMHAAIDAADRRAADVRDIVKPTGRMTWNTEDNDLIFGPGKMAPVPFDDGKGVSPALLAFLERIGHPVPSPPPVPMSPADLGWEGFDDANRYEREF